MFVPPQSGTRAAKEMNISKKQIILVTDGVYPNNIGGMQMHSLRLLEGFLAKDILVNLFYPETTDDQIPDMFRQQISSGQLILNPISVKKNNLPGAYLLAEYVYSKKVWCRVKNMADIPVYAQGLTSLYFINKHHKVIVNPHGLEPFQHYFQRNKASTIYRMLFKYLFKRARYVISLGGKLTDILRDNGVTSRKIKEIPNGIDKGWLFNNYEMKNNQPIKLLFVGRNEPRKALFILLSVFEDFNAEFELSVVGAYPKQQDNNVNYIGEVRNENELKKIFDQHDILVCPSLAEGMPTVILEAMARGLAIIATNVGACSLLVDETNGWLIPPGNERALGRALQSVSDAKNGLHELKKQSKVKAQKYTWEQIIEQTKQLVDEI